MGTGLKNLGKLRKSKHKKSEEVALIDGSTSQLHDEKDFQETEHIELPCNITLEELETLICKACSRYREVNEQQGPCVHLCHLQSENMRQSKKGGRKRKVRKAGSRTWKACRRSWKYFKRGLVYYASSTSSIFLVNPMASYKTNSEQRGENGKTYHVYT